MLLKLIIDLSPLSCSLSLPDQFFPWHYIWAMHWSSWLPYTIQPVLHFNHQKHWWLTPAKRWRHNWQRLTRHTKKKLRQRNSSEKPENPLLWSLVCLVVSSSARMGPSSSGGAGRSILLSSWCSSVSLHRELWSDAWWSGSRTISSRDFLIEATVTGTTRAPDAFLLFSCWPLLFNLIVLAIKISILYAFWVWSYA